MAETYLCNMSNKMEISIPYKDKTIPGVVDCVSLDQSNLSGKPWIVLTHGAGGDLKTPQLTSIANFLAIEGFVVLRFTCKGLNIKYRVRVFTEVINFLQKTYAPKKGIFIGGRSMGARAAAMLCTDPEATKNISVVKNILGVICLSYPLHKPKNTIELRDEPLKKLRIPVFFLSGTKDEMCDKDVFENVLCNLKSPFKVHWLEGCDHSAKSKENYQDDMYCTAFKEVSNWCACTGRKD